MADDENKVAGFSQRTLVTAGILFFAVLFCTIFLILPIVGGYNGLVNAELQIHKTDANIRADLMRRADLIPNLVSVVEGSAKFEKSTLTDVIAMRTQATVIKEQIQNAKTPEELEASQNTLTGIIGRLLMLTEQYPTLQTTQQFRDLSAQITATENQILVDRQTYNTAVLQYQSMSRSFPTNLIAGFFGFYPDKYSMYRPQNETYAYSVPHVTFDLGSI